MAPDTLTWSLQKSETESAFLTIISDPCGDNMKIWTSLVYLRQYLFRLQFKRIPSIRLEPLSPGASDYMFWIIWFNNPVFICSLNLHFQI